MVNHSFCMFSRGVAATAALTSLILFSACSSSSDPTPDFGDPARSASTAEDSVRTRQRILNILMANDSTPTVTGLAYNVQASTASVPVRFNMPSEKIESSEVALILTDNPDKELNFGGVCTEMYINNDDIDADGITTVYARGLVPMSKYRYRSYIRYNDDEMAYGNELTFETSMPDKFEADPVDLGLSVKWAFMNLGASRCYQSGVYYYYGEPKRDAEAAPTLPSDLNSIGGTTYDPATVELGDGWSSPTLSQILELVNSCSWVKGEENGVKGYKVYGRGDFYMNYIFIPFVGYYSASGKLNTTSAFMLWSSDVSDAQGKSYALVLNPDGSLSANRINQSWRLPVRPVQAK